MLRKIRIILAAVFFIAITILFLDPAGVVYKWFGWTAKAQFLPAILSLNLLVIILTVIVTLVLGRIYCSVICPLGVFQDIVSNISGRRKGKKNRFTSSKEVAWLRYLVWTLFFAAVIFGVQAFVALIEPYSAFGRIVTSIKHPMLPTAIIAAVTLVVIAILAWRNGRTWCNTICPVGTLLSFFSRCAMFRPVIDTEKCKDCKTCEKRCKASCINIASHKVDYSRCVACFDCIDNCKFDALHYEFAWDKGKKAEKPAAAGDGKSDAGRRAFLTSSALAIGTAALKAQDLDAGKNDGGFAEILPKVSHDRTEPLTPFGSKSVKDFYDRCTACQLCVSQCPNNVLKPSTDLMHFMQPYMTYENGYCRPECTICSQVCPAGAIEPLTKEEKISFHIGVATVERDLCIVERDGVNCGNCSRHCPAEAITMVPKDPGDPASLLIPAVNEAKCIGCGACENLCPSRPLSAIHVNGLAVHKQD
ncbi:MAG: 4Fe-4S binding protein [Bacteroidales bacterium]|nr:4Fe-4S binding protein [Bacteroidales bacterium]